MIRPTLTAARLSEIKASIAEVKAVLARDRRPDAALKLQLVYQLDHLLAELDHRSPALRWVDMAGDS
jgi:hypothetical protein